MGVCIPMIPILLGKPTFWWGYHTFGPKRWMDVMKIGRPVLDFHNERIFEVLGKNLDISTQICSIYTACIPGTYCLLGSYRTPTTCCPNQSNPITQVLLWPFRIWRNQIFHPECEAMPNSDAMHLYKSCMNSFSPVRVLGSEIQRIPTGKCLDDWWRI